MSRGNGMPRDRCPPIRARYVTYHVGEMCYTYVGKSHDCLTYYFYYIYEFMKLYFTFILCIDENTWRNVCHGETYHTILEFWNKRVPREQEL